MDFWTTSPQGKNTQKTSKSWFKIDYISQIWENLLIAQFYHEIWARSLFFKELSGRRVWEQNYYGVTSQKFSVAILFNWRKGSIQDYDSYKLFQPPIFFSNNSWSPCWKRASLLYNMEVFFGIGGDNYSINRIFRKNHFQILYQISFTNSHVPEIDLASGTDEERLQSRLKLHYRSGGKIKVSNQIL